MSQNDDPIKQALIARINVRLRLWNILWVAFLSMYFVLGGGSVLLSALAATDVIADTKVRQLLSVAAAVCVALLGFLRPEVRYRNLVRAWRELDVEKSRYMHGPIDEPTERILQALARTERIATDDEHDSSRPKEDQQDLINKT